MVDLARGHPGTLIVTDEYVAGGIDHDAIGRPETAGKMLDRPILERNAHEVATVFRIGTIDSADRTTLEFDGRADRSRERRVQRVIMVLQAECEMMVVVAGPAVGKRLATLVDPVTIGNKLVPSSSVELSDE